MIIGVNLYFLGTALVMRYDTVNYFKFYRILINVLSVI